MQDEKLYIDVWDESIGVYKEIKSWPMIKWEKRRFLWFSYHVLVPLMTRAQRLEARREAHRMAAALLAEGNAVRICFRNLDGGDQIIWEKGKWESFKFPYYSPLEDFEYCIPETIPCI